MEAIHNDPQRNGQETIRDANIVAEDFTKRATVDSGLAGTGEWLGRAEDFFSRISRSASVTIKKYPFQVGAMGLAAGALVAALVGRSRKA